MSCTHFPSAYCMAPVKVGPCRASFPRWHYKAETGSCEKFIYGGCKPNKNNYLSEGECMLACRGVTASLERSFVLPTKEECGSACHPDQLTCDSGCCLDRALECDDVKQCSDGSDENFCSKLSQTFNRLLNVNISANQARCVEPPLTGPCRASFTRWYYDPTDRKCQRFTFGGCEGNENSFEKELECSNSCKGVTEKNVFSRGMFERIEKDEEEIGESVFWSDRLSVRTCQVDPATAGTVLFLPSLLALTLKSRTALSMWVHPWKDAEDHIRRKAL
ncbi:hypothetical protein ATANTOWER_020873 [Ataeniobius toweri]|uniref:BPTI/Kunitz inhibitor domain-containing protein n=1 Tax=Ataeniobius toweri TaxID=208326 RepID=A0ABU7B1N9_9TELE|nr:hypothetical protein [Ataeniobius toweri]